MLILLISCLWTLVALQGSQNEIFLALWYAIGFWWWFIGIDKLYFYQAYGKKHWKKEMQKHYIHDSFNQ